MAFPKVVLADEKGSAARVDVNSKLQLLDETRLVAEAKRGKSAPFDELWWTHARGILRIASPGIAKTPKTLRKIHF
jgi:hypothetical protein